MSVAAVIEISRVGKTAPDRDPALKAGKSADMGLAHGIAGDIGEGKGI